MTKGALIGLAALLAATATGVQALTLETLTAPDGGPRFTDPGDKRPLAPLSGGNERDSSTGTLWPGANFSFSGSSSGNPRFIPGYNVPGQYGPAIDPQTRDPYPR